MGHRGNVTVWTEEAQWHQDFDAELAKRERRGKPQPSNTARVTSITRSYRIGDVNLMALAFVLRQFNQEAGGRPLTALRASKLSSGEFLVVCEHRPTHAWWDDDTVEVEVVGHGKT